jgi:hypothetical protein
MSDASTITHETGLSRGTAALIVAAVEKDKESKRVMPRTGSVLPKSWGVSGGIRNILIMGPGLFNPFNQGPTTEEEAFVCTGIADITSAAINAAGIGAVKRASPISRGSHTGVSVEHTATRIDLGSGRSFVFDWHATLDRDNPLIYASPADFEQGRKAVPFKEFTGYL